MGIKIMNKKQLNEYIRFIGKSDKQRASQYRKQKNEILEQLNQGRQVLSDRCGGLSLRPVARRQYEYYNKYYGFMECLLICSDNVAYRYQTNGTTRVYNLEEEFTTKCTTQKEFDKEIKRFESIGYEIKEFNNWEFTVIDDYC